MLLIIKKQKMNTMDMDKKLVKSQAKSQLIATRIAERWTEDHDFRIFTDRDGMPWSLTLKREDKIGPVIKEYTVLLELRAQVSIKELIRTGTFDEKKDRRMVELLSQESIPLILCSVKLSASSEEEVKKQEFEWKKNSKKKISQTSFHTEKRRQVCLWFDKKCSF